LVGGEEILPGHARGRRRICRSTAPHVSDQEEEGPAASDQEKGGETRGCSAWAVACWAAVEKKRPGEKRSWAESTRGRWAGLQPVPREEVFFLFSFYYFFQKSFEQNR